MAASPSQKTLSASYASGPGSSMGLGDWERVSRQTDLTGVELAAWEGCARPTALRSEGGADTPVQSSEVVKRLGVSLAGAEFSEQRLPGRVNFDYVYPTKREVYHSLVSGNGEAGRAG
jgi:hypothetical protein